MKKGIYHYPHYYDILYGFDRSIETFMLDALFQLYDVDRGSSLLELGCGTGQIGLQLVKFGWQVTGLDMNKEMLEYMEEKAKKENLCISSIAADMSQFSVVQKYKAGYCPAGSFGLLENDSQVLLHFTSLYNVLEDDGIYIIDLGISEGKTSKFNYSEAEFAIEKNGICIQLQENKIQVKDPQKEEIVFLDWDCTPFEYNFEHFTTLVARSGHFKILDCYPKIDETEEGIAIFDIACSEKIPQTDRAMVVLKKLTS